MSVGMRSIRWLGTLASVICAGCAVVFLWSALAFGWINFFVVGATYAAAVWSPSAIASPGCIPSP